MAFQREDDRLFVLTWLEPGGHLPEHFHPTLDERWEVLEGRRASSSTAAGTS